METENVTLIAALIAGVLSFFSPCVLPLVPAYLGYLTGCAVGELKSTRRLTTLVHALFFVLGFGLIFMTLGATAGLLGQLIYPLIPYIVKLGGVLLIVFGLHIMGLISLPFLNLEKRLELNQERKKNYATSFLVGLVFAAGWTPCVGPILTAILILAADSQTATTGALLLAVYTLGLGLPFLGVAGLVNVALPILRRSGRYLRALSLVSGALLIAMGFLLLTGLFEQLNFWFMSLVPA